MNISFDSIDEIHVKKFFPEFFNKDSVFFEILSNSNPIGFYGIKTITDKVCEGSIYFSEDGRKKITKQLVLKCIKLPALLGFDKMMIRTKLEKLRRFYSKLTKYGFNFLFKHNEMYLFEVLL